MSTLQNDILLKALQRQSVPYTPVWFMRQAGRYLPEYRQLREKAQDFIHFYQSPELATEATLQPLNRFDLDAAIIFSDILTIPAAMGMQLEFVEKSGPRFLDPIRHKHDINQLNNFDPNKEMRYLLHAIKQTQEQLKGKVPLIGFCGSPWTLACYMIEGQGSKNFAHGKAMLYQNPQAAHQLIEKLTDAVRDVIQMQIEAGVDVIMVFDSWGGILTPTQYQQFSLEPAIACLEGITRTSARGNHIPTILFTKGGSPWLTTMSQSGYDALGLDWTISLDAARLQVANRVALQGNLDPCALLGDPHSLRTQIGDILAQYGNQVGHVFNLGHGVLPETPPENVKIAVDTIHEFSKSMHQAANK